MSKSDPTPDELKQQGLTPTHDDRAFKTHGVDRQAALDYLESPEGRLYRQRLIEADHEASADTINRRAIEQLASGRSLPRMETIGPDDPLVKAVPRGELPTSYTPFFGKRPEFERALAEGHAINDRFGLPLASEAPVYDLVEIRPRVRTQVFVSTVAPTSELGGQVTHHGGAKQYLVPDRKRFTDPVRIASIGDDLALHDDLVVRRGLGTSIAFSTPAEMDAASRGLAPKLARGATLFGAAAVVWDATTTSSKASDSLHHRNVTGARSQIEHFVGRNVGGFGLAAVGAELGSLGGPVGTVAGGFIGGGIGAFGGQKLMDAYDQHKISNQTDAQGRHWHHDPQHPERGWTREVPSGEIGYAANHPVVGYSVMPTPGWRRVQADPALAARLTFQANNTAVELALAHPAPPRDPYTQPAAAQDSPSRLPAPWQRDAASGSWSRTVTDAVLEHGLKNMHVETATPSRAAALDAAAHATLADNLAHSRRGIAARYQAIYAQRDWQQFDAMPDAVTDALHAPTNTLDASDGHAYTRDAQGHWSTPGRLWGQNLAEGNLRSELDATAQLIATTFAATHTMQQAPAQVDAQTIPSHLRDFRHPGHPLHASYDILLQHVHAMEDRVRMPHGEHSEQAAAALLDRHSVDRLGPATRVELHGEGKSMAMHLITHERAAGSTWPTVERRTPVSVFDAVARSVDDASGDWSRRELPHLYQPSRQVAETPSRDPSMLEPCDLRRRDHPRHAAFAGMRERIEAAYAQYGIARSAEQLDRATAAVMRDLPAHARLPDQVQLLPDPQTGRIGPDSSVLTRDAHSFLPCTTTTHAAAMQQAPEAAFQQLDQLAMQQQMQQAPTQAQPAQAMGR